MLRQLHFLLPDIPQSEQLCSDVNKMKIAPQQIHAIVNSDCGDISKLNNLCEIKSADAVDKEILIEFRLWRSNLLIFLIGLVTFISLIVLDEIVWSVVPLGLMIVTFLLGYNYVTRMPDSHWRDYLTAIRHGEILMIIDLPKSSVHRIDRIVQRNHPEDISAGVCWKM